MSPADGATAPMTPIPFRVTGRNQETEDTWTLELEPQNGRSLPPFQPGQFSMLYAFGTGEVPISASGDLSRDEGRLIHTIRAAGMVTSALCACEPGQPVGVRGPFGRPWPVAQAEGADVVVVAGGLGLAPLRSVVYHVLANRERFGRVALLYGARTPANMLYRGELEAWRGRFDAQVEVTVDGASRGWRGRVGVVPKLIPGAEFEPEKAVALVCGPEVMMRFTAAALEERGVPRDRIFVSLERNMHCAIGMCGHCQFREYFVCKDGPVFPLPAVERLMRTREL